MPGYRLQPLDRLMSMDARISRGVHMVLEAESHGRYEGWQIERSR